MGGQERGDSNYVTVLLIINTNTILLTQVTGAQGQCKKTWQDYDQGHRIQMLLSCYINNLNSSSFHVSEETSRFGLLFTECKVWGFLPYCSPWRSHIKYSWCFLSKLFIRDTKQNPLFSLISLICIWSSQNWLLILPESSVSVPFYSCIYLLLWGKRNLKCNLSQKNKKINKNPLL